jgi:hypothetical protein
MDQGYFLKATTRREMLRAASYLAGGSALAGFMPHDLLAGVQAAADGKGQTPSSAPVDPVEQMKAQMAGVPLQTLKLRDNIQMLYGPGREYSGSGRSGRKNPGGLKFCERRAQGEACARRDQQHAIQNGDQHPLAF